MIPAVRSPYWAGRAPAEHRQAFGQYDAVQAVLHAVMLAANVELAIGILRHAGRLQHDLVQAGVVSGRHRLDGLAGDRVGGRAGLRLDGVPRRIEAPRGDHHLAHDVLARRRGLGCTWRGGDRQCADTDRAQQDGPGYHQFLS